MEPPNAFSRAADLLDGRRQVRPWRLGNEHDWHAKDCPVCGGAHARPEQLAPGGDWLTWLILSGRGWGKTRTGAEWLAEQMEASPNTEWAIIAPKLADAKTVCVEGMVGLLRVLSPGVLRAYNKNTYEVALTNGARAFMYGAEEPRVGVRGRNLSGAWCDEMASWRYREVWDEGLLPALRIGRRPRVVVTTTPRPVPLIQELIERRDGTVHVTRGSTFDNAANLSAGALEELRRRYEGTRIGRQELYAEILDDVPGALWTRQMLEDNRVREQPEMRRIVVAIDPAVTSGANADETGIVVAGLGVDGHGYVLADRSCRMSPDGWARRAVIAHQEFEADCIVAEANNGGEMVSLTVGTVARSMGADVRVKLVHASRGKRVRAEPVAALYEQGRVRHLGGLPELEDQQCAFLPEGGGSSPDRVDALVWALTELMLGANQGEAWIRAWQIMAGKQRAQ